MEGSLRELADYRLERAQEMLHAAEENLRIGQWKTALNRSYYAIFHAMRAVNILDGFDSSKHSGVIAYFTQNYLKTQELDRALSKIIKEASYLREKSDYDDFYIASRAETERQIENANLFCNKVEQYLKENIDS
ncbi:MAG: HEPN domain-containing protein [Clostridium sp.]|nr:HEPN domain-containing protein [Clostridium sp.]